MALIHLPNLFQHCGCIRKSHLERVTLSVCGASTTNNEQLIIIVISIIHYTKQKKPKQNKTNASTTAMITIAETLLSKSQNNGWTPSQTKIHHTQERRISLSARHHTFPMSSTHQQQRTRQPQGENLKMKNLTLDTGNVRIGIGLGCRKKNNKKNTFFK